MKQARKPFSEIVKERLLAMSPLEVLRDRRSTSA